MRQAFKPQPALADRSTAPSVNPYQILDLVKILRRDLGLTSNDLVILHALISFLPKTDGRVTDELRIVFPSNASLSERANGLDERTIRRCVARLGAAGLIQRRDSATRKRFPLRYGGVIRGAFGFDLAPMFELEPELRTRAKQIKMQTERLRSLRAEALALRIEALHLVKDANTLIFLTEVRTVLRRTTVTHQEIINLIEKMTMMIEAERSEGGFPAGNLDNQRAMTPKMTAADGQNVRHVDSKRLNIKKTTTATFGPKPNAKDPKTMEWADFTHLAAFYPEEPQSSQSILRIITDVGLLLRIETRKLISHLRSKGPAKLLLALDAIIGKAGKITYPSTYLDRMMECPG